MTDHTNELEIQIKQNNGAPKMHAGHVGCLAWVVRLSGTTTHKTPI